MNIHRSLSVFAAVCLALAPLFRAHAEDAAKPDAGTITKPEQALAQVPRPQLFALRGGPKQTDAVNQVTSLLRTNVEGKMATLKIKVDRVETYRNKDEQTDRYRIKAEDGHLIENGTNLKVFVWVHFEPSENAKVSGKKKGEELQVTGKITNANVSGGTSPALHLDLDNVKMN